MKRLIPGIAAAVLVVVAAAWFGSREATAQAPGFLTLRGPGSSIGVTIREITPEEADTAKLTPPAGVVIESVREGSPAERAGFKAGDIVVEFDTEPVRSVRQFTRLVQETPPRRSVDAVVVRGTARQTIAVAPEAAGEFGASLSGRLPGDLDTRIEELLRNRSGDLTLRIDPDGVRARRLGGPTLGVTLTPLTDQLAEYFGVTEGALISSVEADSPAAEAGLRAGDVLTAVQGRSVRTAADVAAAIRAVPPGGGVDLSVTRDRAALTLKATIPTPPTPQTRSGRRGLPV